MGIAVTELGVIDGATIAINGGDWLMTFLLVGCLPALLTGGIVGELYARIEPRFQQPQRLGWLFAGVVAWFVVTLLLK